MGFGDASLAVAGGVEYGTPSINTVQPITIPVELDFRFALSGVLGQGGPCLGDRVEHLCFNMVAVVDAAYFTVSAFSFSVQPTVAKVAAAISRIAIRLLLMFVIFRVNKRIVNG